MERNGKDEPSRRAPRDDDDRSATGREVVDETSEESFPASDPPGWAPLHLGTPTPRPKGDAPDGERR